MWQSGRGQLECVNVFGGDYDTPDGTGVRDCIHVVDLATGPYKALYETCHTSGLVTYNLGTGVGYSVLDIIKNFEKACGKRYHQDYPRRPGDIDMCYADPTKS